MRGLSLPSWLVAGCAALVALALVAFVVTGERDADVSAAPSDDPASSSGPSADQPGAGDGHADGGAGPDGSADGSPDGKGQDQPVERRTAYVEVYNNSGISGLAGETSAVLQDSGWRVVTTDNWYGQIPADTVYYPEQLQAQARLLARDLGVDRLHQAVEPMSFDRITVILTTA